MSLKEKLTMEEIFNHPEMPGYFENDPERWIEQGIWQ
jgi:hypothetical protein